MKYYSARHKQRVNNRLQRQIKIHLLTALVVVLIGIMFMAAFAYGVANLPPQ